MVALTVEVAEDAAFQRVVATARALARREADYTCRVLVGNLRSAQTYWYRFVDAEGRGSRIGRTRTAPQPDDRRPVRFAFVSCQSICEGAQNAYRRMMYEDERVDDGEQLAFVLHLGDFIYEVVDYPEDRPERHRYDRRLRDAIRFPDGERLSKTSHIAASLADYRALYRAFIDMGGHGYATVRFAADAMECEFVCIPRPLERSASNDGGPIRYRVVHRCRRWGKGERPALGQQVVEGDPGLGL